MQSFVRRSGLPRPHAPSLHLKLQDQPVVAVVVHDQRAPVSQPGQLVRLLGVDRGFHLFGHDREVERRSLLGLAFRPDPAAHELRETLADRQTEPRPPVSPSRRCVDLAEHPE